MKLIDVKMVCLHGPVIIGSRNFKDKIPAQAGLKLQYDNDKDVIYITWNGEMMKIGNNLAGVIPFKPEDLGIESNPYTPVPIVVSSKGSAMKAGIVSAQVETPHGLTRSKL